MKSFGVKARCGLTLLKGGVSMVALTALAATLVAPAYAQDAAPTDEAAAGAQEVVVVGVRRAMKSAQQIKKDADTIVDSITANDIGSFPDKSVAEALQRVAGITVNRFAASDDTSHFSAEPSGVVVRGLQQVRSEFNGRDIFTADSNRGLSWSDVSPELMGGVDVYKNQTAELIEGGIAGTVNLRTRLPFDQKGRVLAVSADYTTGDLVQKGAPTISGIFSDRWDTELGEFGVMLNAAHSQVYTNSQGIQFGRYAAVVDPTHLDGAAGGSGLWNDPAKRYLPGSASLRDNTYDRVRDGVAFATQWQNHDHTMLLTLQYNKSKKREQMEERVVTFSSGTDSWAKPLTWVGDGVNGTRCLETDPCVFNDHGGLQSGTLVQSMDAWMGTVGANTGAADPAGNYTCYDWTCKDTSVDGGGVRGTGLGTASRYSDSTNDTSDIGLNFKWDVTDRLKLNFDIQHVEATQTNYDIEGALNTYANPSFDLTGNHPIINAADGASFNDIDDPDVVGDALTNPGNYSAHHIMDHVTDSEGHMDAVRADLQYSFDSPWLNSLKAGVRYADREQTVRWTTYNWKSNVNSWSDYSADNFFITGSKYPAGGYEMVQWNQDFYGGGATNLTELPYMTMAMLKDRAGLAAAFGNQSYKPMTNGAVNSNEWIPICSRAGEDANCFLPAELSDVSEKTKAAYIQLKFGGPDATIFNGVTVTGNIGVRYVETQNTSTGGVNYSTMTYAPYGTSAPPAGSPPGTPDVYNWSYFISGLTGTPPEVDPLASPADQATQLAARIAYVNDPANFTDDRAFLTKSTDKATVDVTHKNWLPSFNVRFGLTDKWFLRFAASRALSRPDIGNLKAYSSVGAATPSAADLVCGKAFECTGGVPTKANIKYTGSAQNPYLRPVTADQFDLSVENYFSSTGSVTFNLFYKKFHDYIQFGTYDREFTNNGVTRSVQMNGPMNGDGASIKGFELAYQSFFDFLPAPFDGFGIQANYTHLHNTGINGAAVKKETAGEDGSSDPDIGGVKRSADNTFLNLPLESLSDDSYNLIGMYEKGAWSARLAYNWRSKFMVTAQDCCTTFPVWQDASGYLDGRVAFRVNEHIELSVEGSNLLSTETKLYQQVDGPTDTYPDGKATFLPSSWFKNDRRLTASIRLKY